jgi:hypothetical protein
MVAGLFDEFFGVPTHPLAVHAPVVLIPLLAIAAVVVLFRSSWRERATVPIAGLSVVMVAMLFVAKESGQAVKSSGNVLGNVDRHQDLGNQTFVLSLIWLVLAVGAAAALVVGRRNSTRSLSAAVDDGGRLDQVTMVFNVLAVIALVVTTVWLIRTGHAGAESRWVG